MVPFLLRRFVAIVGIVGVCCQFAIYASRPDLAPIRSDGFEYYAYLPDWFLFHDTSLQAVADDCCGGRFPDGSAMARNPGTGRWVNPHPVGVALLVSPFFFAAHALSRWSGLPPDGFSLYYQAAAALAGLSYLLAGLAILRSLLRHVSDGVALATLVALTFGTNLFHYGVFDATFSHAFSFFLVCALMALTERWWAAPAWTTSLALGLVGGFVVLVRHSNAVLLALVALYGLENWADVRPRLASLKERRWQALAGCLLAALVVAPQLVLYRAAADAWVANPYRATGGSFAFFASPHLAGVLFSVQKGLFFWSPVLLLALPGTLVGSAWRRRWQAAAVVTLALQAYLVASWADWQLGGGFGHRGFTEALGLFAPFLAATFSWSAGRARRTKWAVTMVAVIACALSSFLMVQYWRGLVPIANTTMAQYRDLFFAW